MGTQEGADTIINGVVAYDMKNTVVENPYNMPRAGTEHDDQPPGHLDEEPAFRR